MSRMVLDDSQIHPAIKDKITQHQRDIVDEVSTAVGQNDVVVVGMMVNPVCKKARKLLDGAGQPFKYLEYGGYHSLWRRRNALKMWTGWPTFPMVFVKGTLVGGATELSKLIEDGELATMLGA